MKGSIYETMYSSVSLMVIGFFVCLQIGLLEYLIFVEGSLKITSHLKQNHIKHFIMNYSKRTSFKFEHNNTSRYVQCKSKKGIVHCVVLNSPRRPNAQVFLLHGKWKKACERFYSNTKRKIIPAAACFYLTQTFVVQLSAFRQIVGYDVNEQYQAKEKSSYTRRQQD